MTADELATRIRVSPSAVRQWETGHSSPREDRITDIADALGLTLSGFYGAAAKLEESPAEDPPPPTM